MGVANTKELTMVKKTSTATIILCFIVLGYSVYLGVNDTVTKALDIIANVKDMAVRMEKLESNLNEALEVFKHSAEKGERAIYEVKGAVIDSIHDVVASIDNYMKVLNYLDLNKQNGIIDSWNKMLKK